MNCPNCLCKYNNLDYLPKILVKCGHTFCIKCIENIQQSKNDEIEIEKYLKCPTCNEETVINDINNLPKNIAIIESSLNDANNTITSSNLQNKILCQIHSKDIEAFCENDKIMLCVSCIIENGHKNHDLCSLEKAAQKERLLFEKGYFDVLQIEQELNFNLNEIVEIMNKLMQNSESNFKSLEQFYNGIREIILERENLLKNKIETVLKSELEFFQSVIDKINDQISNIKKIKIEKDNYDKLNEFEILKRSKDKNETLKLILNKPPKINREIVFFELKKEDELYQLKKLIFCNPNDEYNNSNNINNISIIPNSGGPMTTSCSKKNVSSPSINHCNDVKKLEKKTKQLIETKSNIQINPKNILNAARDSLKFKKTLGTTTNLTPQNITVNNCKNNAANNNVNINYSTNINNSNNPSKSKNIEKSHIQKRNKTPVQFDIDDIYIISNIKSEIGLNTNNITTNVSSDNIIQDKMESESYNFVGKTGEKEPPKGNKQKILALFPALKMKISNQKINNSNIMINDMDSKGREISPSFKNEERINFIKENLIETSTNNGKSKLIEDETIKLDFTKNYQKDNLFDSTININVNNISQLQCSTQSMNTDLASLYKTFNYSIILLGGKPDGTIRKLELETKIWKEIKNLSIERSDFCAIMYKEKKILLIGGKINETINDTIELLNLDEMAIKKLDIKLKTPKSNFGSVYINSKLFVAGGYTGKETLNTLEFFDKKTKNWNELHKMNIKRKEFNMIVGPDNNFFALGGTDERDSTLKSVEKFEIEKNVWRKIEDMNQARKNFSAIAMPDGIYVLGGNDGCQYLKSLEKYDYFQKKWKYLQDMNYPRAHFSCVSSNDCRYIYSIGGYDGKPLNSIERYDITLNKWEIMNKMNNFKYKHQAVFLGE